MSEKISIIAPFFNEEKNIKSFYDRLSKTLNGLNLEYEVICVDDGSMDNTFNKLTEINEKDSKWKIISLSRNFGHQSAITMGQKLASGDFVGIIDTDLQDPPELFKELYKKIKNGYDCVYAVRNSRKENFILNFCYKFFYLLMNKISIINIPRDTGDFCLITKRINSKILSLKEKSRFVRGLRAWVGFKQTDLKYDREKREKGKSKYSILNLFNLALDGITNFSYTPLRLSTIFGTILGVLTLLAALIFVIIKIINPDYFIAGFTLNRFLILFSTSVQLIFLGIIGEYLIKIFLEVKRRPVAIIKNSKGFDQNLVDEVKKDALFSSN